MSRPEKTIEETPNKGSFRLITQEIEKRSPILINKAKKIPNFLTFSRLSSGSFPTSKDIKIILSIPKTISIRVRVNNAVKESAFSKASIVGNIYPKIRKLKRYLL
jgi:hypothetical protein